MDCLDGPEEGYSDAGCLEGPDTGNDVVRRMEGSDNIVYFVVGSGDSGTFVRCFEGPAACNGIVC